MAGRLQNIWKVVERLQIGVRPHLLLPGPGRSVIGDLHRGVRLHRRGGLPNGRQGGHLLGMRSGHLDGKEMPKGLGKSPTTVSGIGRTLLVAERSLECSTEKGDEFKIWGVVKRRP